MLRASLFALVVLGSACTKQEESKPTQPAKPAPATTQTGTVGADGVRTVQIEANVQGYVPDKISGKPGEKLKLVFTRTVDGECLAELKTPDGKKIELPKGTPVEVAVTVPESGALTFACGMDMFTGQIVAEPKG